MADDQDKPARAETPDSNGPNARPRTETIAQTGAGIPDDTGSPIEVDPAEEKRIADRIRSL
ncbi:MAG TPA: hypothetical protein VEH84_08090 [Alphaproteobacteria bacterium]|nr:hypothetical protein [Alphaproteobacteria bacterium]